VAVWWVVFALPLFCSVPEPVSRHRTTVSLSVITKGLQQLHRTLSRIRHYKELALFLLAFWIYNDGIGTIIKIATAYGDEIGIDHNQMLIALVLTQLIWLSVHAWIRLARSSPQREVGHFARACRLYDYFDCRLFHDNAWHCWRLAWASFKAGRKR